MSPLNFLLWSMIVLQSLHRTIGTSCFPVAKVINGRIRSRANSRIVRFQCFNGFELVGNRYATCIHGSWDVEFPICVRPGCRKITLLNGITHYNNRDATVIYICQPGYELKGASFSYCSGNNWNVDPPECVKVAPKTQELSCDFEQENLCGWLHDPSHDFDWTRESRNTPSGHTGTGPSYDHTLGEGKDGHYLYIESTSRNENDKARLLSPLYPAEISKNGCFSFYYHMYGKSIGKLRIYQRPSNVEFSTIINDDRLLKQYMLFEKEGNQGNRWYSGFSNLNEYNDNFEIIIEGVRGDGYVSDIAIDDIAILQNEQCAEKFKEHSESTVAPVTVRVSCQNICGVVTGGNECKCSAECIDNGTCCADYRDLCLFETTMNDEVSSVPPLLPTSLMIQATMSDEPTKLTETTSTTTSTPAPTTSTTQKPTIKLTFQTKDPPMINATGILTLNVSKTVKSSSTPTTITETPSTVKIEPYGTTKPPILRQITKAPLKYGLDYHDTKVVDVEQPSSNTTSISIASACVVIILIVSIVLIKNYHMKIKCGEADIPKTLWKLKNGRNQSNNADMKFLVQDEELEHDYD